MACFLNNFITLFLSKFFSLTNILELYFIGFFLTSFIVEEKINEIKLQVPTKTCFVIADIILLPAEHEYLHENITYLMFLRTVIYDFINTQYLVSGKFSAGKLAAFILFIVISKSECPARSLVKNVQNETLFDPKPFFFLFDTSSWHW